MGEGDMQRADVQTLNDRLTELAEAFGAKPVTKGAMAVWVGVLKDYPIEDICDAIAQWARTKTKFPAPSEISGLCSARLSDRVEAGAVREKAKYSAASCKILADPRIARTHLEKCFAVLKRDAEWIAEREAMLRQEEPV